MANLRKRAIESLVNDECVMITQDIYKWRDIYFQILPYKQIKKGWSQYNKLKYGRTIYGYRELNNMNYNSAETRGY